MRWLAYTIFILLILALILFILDPAASLGDLWFRRHVGSLNLSQAIVQRYINAELWDSVMVPLLKQPPWYTLAILAGVLFVPYGLWAMMRKRRR